jgi:serine/threonine protein kinase
MKIKMIAMNDLPSSLLGGRYEMLGRIGSGGMAYVYRARDLNLQRDVAIKVLRDNYIQDPTFLQRFLQEARSVANLSHPNIVTVFDFGHDESRYFIVMEYISGTDLKTIVRRLKQLSVAETLEFMTKICAGVGYAHRAGIVHCDLKPQNILVTADEQVRVTDFGISRALASIDPLERSEIVWGSPLYLAPEQSAGYPPSPASDVYSLGVMMFEMLTGQLPFQAENAVELAELHQTTPPPSMRTLNPNIPPQLEQVVVKVLSKEPSARYRTADQLGRVLANLTINEDDFLHGQAPLPDPEGGTIAMPVSAQDTIDWAAIALALLAFLAIGGLIPLWLMVCLLYPSCPINIG